MTGAAEAPLGVARKVLAGREAWVVGGLIRDRAVGRGEKAPTAPIAATTAAATAAVPPPVDVDLVVRDDPAEVARALGRAGAGASFALSAELGAWRVVARDGSWQIDVERLRADSLEADLALRDFTINAVAQTLDGAHTIDPLGGLEDLAAKRLRATSARAFADDPLRVLRLVRLAVGYGLHADDATLAGARACAARLLEVSPERVFGELKLIVDSADPVSGIGLLHEIGAMAVVLPELEALRGVQQNRFHHRDAFGHTMEVLGQVVALTTAYFAGDGGPLGDSDVKSIVALLTAPLADGLTRAGALRWGALLHDAAKPVTRAVGADGRVTFLGHDSRGGELASELMVRMRASQRLRTHVAGLVRHHLRLGFLVHQPQPLDRHAVYSYLRTCQPVEVDVTLLSVADRLATRGDRSERVIEAHLQLARAMLGDAVRWHEQGPPLPLWRGDELARELAIAEGPQLGALLEGLREAQYVGEVGTREAALARARDLLASACRPA